MSDRRRDPYRFDPTQRAGHQSDIPSQVTPAGVPYFPSEAIEVMQLTPGMAAALAGADLAQKDANPAGDINSYTRYTWDSRPPMAFDFMGPINDGSQSAQDLFNGATTIPDGFVGVVRRITFTTSSNFFRVSSFGVFSTSAQLTVLRNGVPIQGMTNMNVGQWGMQTVSIPCYILLNSGDTISGQWNNGLVLYEYGCGFNFWGQLLLDDGRNLPLQAGNMRPEPVVEVSADAVGSIGPTQSTPAPSAPASAAPQFGNNIVTYTAPEYPGPFPPNIGVHEYLVARAQHHAQVYNNFQEFKRQHPNNIINVRGASDLATTPPGVV